MQRACVGVYAEHGGGAANRDGMDGGGKKREAEERGKRTRTRGRGATVQKRHDSQVKSAL